MKKLIIFNWKMSPNSPAEAIPLFNSIKQTKNLEIVVVAPFIYLSVLNTKKRKKLKLGAQNCFWENQGAYTGEISPKMLKNLGAEYVIIGHSERRKYLNETDEMINKKVLAGLKAGLKVVLCVGETKRELRIKNYELGIRKAKNYVKNQITKDLKNIHNSLFKIHNSLIVAYEPVWAISTSGTGKRCQPEYAYNMIQFIKQILVKRYKLKSPTVIYGGSVDSKNIKNFIKYLPRRIPKGFLRGPEIDGALVGGASLKIKEVKKIIKIIK